MSSNNIKYVLMASGGASVATGFLQLSNPDPNSPLPSWFPYVSIFLGGATIYYAVKK